MKITANPKWRAQGNIFDIERKRKVFSYEQKPSELQGAAVRTLGGKSPPAAFRLPFLSCLFFFNGYRS
jgi:hypothetical protein